MVYKNIIWSPYSVRIQIFYEEILNKGSPHFYILGFGFYSHLFRFAITQKENNLQEIVCVIHIFKMLPFQSLLIFVLLSFMFEFKYII